MDELDDIKAVIKLLEQATTFVHSVYPSSVKLVDEDETHVGDLVFDDDEWKFRPLEGQ